MPLLIVLALAAALSSAGGSTPQQAKPAPAGQEACATCHEAVAKQFTASAHGNLATFEQRGQHAGCESCHGAGSQHVESGGDVTKIRAFSQMSTSEQAQACLTCHRQGEAMHWAGSMHASSDVSCTDCHRIHQSRQIVPGLMSVEGMPTTHGTAPAPKGSLAKPETELCLGCHKEQRAKLMGPSHHPVREGRMACSSCHDVHGTEANAGLRTDERPNDLCLKCHQRHQGPFVFEHAPVSENCQTCHDPHGAVANHLLRQNEPFLCLQCHEMHFHSARVSQATPFTLPTGSVTNSNGVSGFMKGFNTRCTACHTRIHGSDLPSQGVTGRGKALIR